ncbi:MAG: ferrous iron transporter B [Elusimicrobiota bacterium]
MPTLRASKSLLRSVLLVGRPNVGKSALFGSWTGRYADVSNYSGTTLELLAARAQGLELVDAPGLLSLSARSEDEAVTRDAVLEARAEGIIQVGSACDVEGSLTLFFELSRISAPEALVLNLCDEAREKGLAIDAGGLSEALGVPVLLASALTGEGLADVQAILRSRAPGSSVPAPLPPELLRAASRLERELPQRARRWVLLALTSDEGLRKALVRQGLLEEEDLPKIEAARREFVRNPSFLFLSSARERSRELAALHVRRREGALGKGAGFGETLGRWALGPWSGPLAALLAAAGLYLFVGVLGAQVIADFLQDRVFGAWILPPVESVVRHALPWSFMQDLLVGPYGLFTMALTYALALILPVVATFFLAFSLLEDSGYLPRFSVITDRLFRMIGLNGKAVLPMLLGLGCGSMAVVSVRILETRRERLLASLLLALAVPCSAQLGLMLGMAGGSGPAVLWAWLGVMAATLLGVGWAASRLLPGAAASFIMEIPPMRRPLPGNVLRKTGLRLQWYLREIIPLFALATLALFLLDRTGALSRLEHGLRPLLSGLLGLPPESAGAFLTGFLRRDYGAAGLYQLHRQGLLDDRQTAVSLTAITLFLPCAAQWLLMLRERGLRFCLFATGFVLAYSIGAAALVNAAWKALGG